LDNSPVVALKQNAGGKAEQPEKQEAPPAEKGKAGNEKPRKIRYTANLNVIVEDLDAGEEAVLKLGATKHEHQPGTTFRVFLDPAGHPFCLCVN